MNLAINTEGLSIYSNLIKKRIQKKKSKSEITAKRKTLHRLEIFWFARNSHFPYTIQNSPSNKSNISILGIKEKIFCLTAFFI